MDLSHRSTCKAKQMKFKYHAISFFNSSITQIFKITIDVSNYDHTHQVHNTACTPNTKPHKPFLYRLELEVCVINKYILGSHVTIMENSTISSKIEFQNHLRLPMLEGVNFALIFPPTCD